MRNIIVKIIRGALLNLAISSKKNKGSLSNKNDKI